MCEITDDDDDDDDGIRSMTGSDSLKMATCLVFSELTSIFNLWPTSASVGMYVLGNKEKEGERVLKIISFDQDNLRIGRNTFPTLERSLVICQLANLQICQILNRHAFCHWKSLLLLHSRRRGDFMGSKNEIVPSGGGNPTLRIFSLLDMIFPILLHASRTAEVRIALISVLQAGKTLTFHFFSILSSAVNTVLSIAEEVLSAAIPGKSVAAH